MGEHIHLTNYEQIERMKAISTLKEKVKTTRAGVKRTYEDFICENVENKYLTEWDSITQSLNKTRSKSVPKEPKNYSELEDNIYFSGLI